jgi:hypothetical protein
MYGMNWRKFIKITLIGIRLLKYPEYNIFFYLAKGTVYKLGIQNNEFGQS